jgi:hypothetical protein
MNWDRLEDLGYQRFGCHRCGRVCWTDTASCEYCKPCSECGEHDDEDIGGDPCVCILEERRLAFEASGAPPF